MRCLVDLSGVGSCKRVQQRQNRRGEYAGRHLDCWTQMREVAVSGSDRASCQEIYVEEEELVFLHCLCILSQNLRKVRLEEIIYCRGSQCLVCLVDPLAAVVAPTYHRPYRCFEMGVYHNLGHLLSATFNLLFKNLSGADSSAFLGNISCSLFFITRKFCC